MGLFERIVEEASREERSPVTGKPDFCGGRSWSPPAPGGGGYVAVEDLEREEKWREREREEVLREERTRVKEFRALRALAHQGVSSPWQGIAFKSLQRTYPAESDRIRWERRTRG